MRREGALFDIILLLIVALLPFGIALFISYVASLISGVPMYDVFSPTMAVISWGIRIFAIGFLFFFA